MKKKLLISISIILLILVVDQILKIWIKTSFVLGEEMPIFGNWVKRHFIENEGMAFGIVFFGGYWGKLLLTLFRIIASGCIIWLIYKMIKSVINYILLFFIFTNKFISIKFIINFSNQFFKNIFKSNNS